MQEEPDSLVDSPFDIDINYEIYIDEQNPLSFKTTRNLNAKLTPEENSPSWTELNYKRCPGCRLDDTEKFCPAAASITDLVDCFSKGNFPATAKVRVVFTDKVISATKPLKNILSSIIGLRMASSGCPALSPFKLMARFHMPFDTPYSAVYRATSSFLLIEALNNSEIDVQNTIKKIHDFYDEISGLNLHFSKRLEKNCSACSMNLLSVFTMTMRLLFEEHLDILKKLT